MKRLLFILLYLPLFLSATNYYVKPDGNDSNTGTSDSQAWGTIAKVNAFSFSASDHVYFQRNGIWTETLIPNRNNLYFDAYGTGAKPVISGLQTVSSWTNLGGHVWESNALTGIVSGVNLVLKDGVPQQVGRYPNADATNGGYLVSTAQSSGSITGPELSSVTNWTGAEVAIRVHRWEIRHTPVTGHSAGVVSFSSSVGGDIESGYGYFFQRDARTLDKFGEWFYNTSTSKLRMYFPADNPTSFLIQISILDKLVDNVYSSISISNISFEGGDKKAVYNYGGNYFSVINCDISNSGKEALTSWYGSNATITGCTVNNSLGSGIRVRSEAAPDNNFIDGNTVDSTGLYAGMESSQESNGGEAIYSYADNYNTVTNNIITNSGYNGISWYGSHANIKYNLINGYNITRDDGGGIYTFEAHGSSFPVRTTRNIISNIVVNGIGNNGGVNGAGNTKANGIYCDEGTRVVIIDSNTVAEIHGAGLICNSTDTITARFNTLYHHVYSHLFERFETAPLIRTMVFTGNVFYPFKFYYTNLQLDAPSTITLNTDMAALGTLNSNYNYKNTGTDSTIFRRGANTGVTSYFEEYKTYSYMTGTIGIEGSSTVINSSNLASEIKYNATSAAVTYNFYGLSKKDVFGTVYNNSATIPAWSSKILIDNGTTISPSSSSGFILRSN